MYLKQWRQVMAWQLTEEQEKNETKDKIKRLNLQNKS